MAAKDMGTKYTCFKCQTKFYDLKKPDPLCPKCGSDQRNSPALRAPEKAERRRKAPPPPPVVVAEPVVEEEAIEEPIEAADDEADEVPDDGDDDF